MWSVILFFALNLVNVVLGTMRSILTVKSTPTVAMLINTVSYTFYAGIVKMTTGQPMWIVLLATAVTNIVGVYIATWIVRKTSKDKLWKVECTFNKLDLNLEFLDELKAYCQWQHISFNYIDIEKYYIVQFYSATQQDSLKIKRFVEENNGKYFASESKTL